MWPQRAEPLCQLARHYRLKTDYALAHLFANQAMAIPRPSDILFLDDSVYDWRALDEYAISAYYVGNFGEGLIANDRLLDEGKLPISERRRVEANKSLCVEQLRKSKG